MRMMICLWLVRSRISFASMVTKDVQRHGKAREESILSPNEVGVLDEDCIVILLIKLCSLSGFSPQLIGSISWVIRCNMSLVKVDMVVQDGSFDPTFHVADFVIRKIGYANSFHVEAYGFNYGIRVLWRDEVVLEVLCVSTQFVICNYRLVNESIWFHLTVVYASPLAVRRKFSWVPLAQMTPREHILWVVGGDFNAIVSSADMLGVPSGR
ncbi:hypothetical protein GQ457_07G010660 [Hibiscus cannabinus]